MPNGRLDINASSTATAADLSEPSAVGASDVGLAAAVPDIAALTGGGARFDRVALIRSNGRGQRQGCLARINRIDPLRWIQYRFGGPEPGP